MGSAFSAAMGPQGPTGPAGQTGPTGSVNAVTSTPSRSLNAVFQPSTTRATLCIYTIQITTTITLGGLQTGVVQLLSDSANPPTTVRAATSSGFSGTLVVGISMTSQQQCMVAYIVPPGDYVKIASSGTATITLVAQSEVTL